MHLILGQGLDLRGDVQPGSPRVPGAISTAPDRAPIRVPMGSPLPGSPRPIWIPDFYQVSAHMGQVIRASALRRSAGSGSSAVRMCWPARMWTVR